MERYKKQKIIVTIVMIFIGIFLGLLCWYIQERITKTEDSVTNTQDKLLNEYSDILCNWEKDTKYIEHDTYTEVIRPDGSVSYIGTFECIPEGEEWRLANG